MPIRFKVLSVVYVVMLLVANGNREMLDNVGGVMGALGILLVLSLLALAPNGSRADRVDRALSGDNWADRIDIERSARDRSARQ